MAEAYNYQRDFIVTDSRQRDRTFTDLEVIDHYNLSPAALGMYQVLQYFLIKGIPASISLLAKKAHCGETSARKYIKELVDAKLVRVHRAKREGTKENEINRYELLAVKIITPVMPEQQPVGGTSESDAPTSESEEISYSSSRYADIRDEPLPERPPIYSIYEQNIGALTSMIAEELTSLCDEYSELWVHDAIRVAVKNEARKLSYVEATLQNWKRDGKRNSKPVQKLLPHRYDPNDPGAGLNLLED